MSNEPNTNPYSQLGKAFQEKVMQALIVDRVWATQFVEVFDVDECFEPAYLKLLANKYIGYYREYKEWPSVDYLLIAVKDELAAQKDVLLRDQMSAFLKKIYANVDLGDIPGIKEKAFTFCRQQLLKKALLKAVDVIASDKYETVVDIMKEAIAKGIPNSPGHDYLIDFDARYSATARRAVPTGIAQLDDRNILKGGLGNGEIGIIIAPTGCGKSHMAVQLGAAACLLGKTVFHYTLEMGEKLIGIRYDSHLTNVPATDCFDNKDLVKEWFKSSGDKLGKLIIKEYPTRTITVNTLRSHIEKMSMLGIRPDLIVVDYAGIMRSTEHYDLPRFELQCIVQELRGLAKELDIPVWTALQSNKDGAKSDVVDVTNAAEGYGQAHEADFIMGLQIPPATKSTGYGTLFIAKNRVGITGNQFRIHLDTSRSRLRILSEAEQEQAEAQEEENSFEHKAADAFRKAIRDGKNSGLNFNRPGFNK